MMPSASSALTLAARHVRAHRNRLPSVRTGGPGHETIYFLTPDFNLPAGGVRVFYRHVDTLNAAGLKASILHSRRGFRCTWFENNTQIADTASVRLGPSDLL